MIFLYNILYYCSRKCCSKSLWCLDLPKYGSVLSSPDCLPERWRPKVPFVSSHNWVTYCGTSSISKQFSVTKIQIFKFRKINVRLFADMTKTSISSDRNVPISCLVFLSYITHSTNYFACPVFPCNLLSAISQNSN